MLCTSTTPEQLFAYVAAATMGVVMPVTLVWIFLKLSGIVGND